MREPSCEPARTICAGYGQREITPDIGAPLAGRPFLRPRLARSVRDPLYARALHLQTGDAQATLLVADLVLVTSSLHQAVAHAADVSPASLMTCATHTHSGPGGYWHGSLISQFMGPYNDATFTHLVRQMAGAVVDARRDAVPSTLYGCLSDAAGANKSRRRADGPVDTSLGVLRLERQERKPILLACFGAHGIAGVDLVPHCATADYPGELCRLLSEEGCHVVFLQGAVGGTNPGWLEPGVSFDEHVRLMGRALHGAVRSAMLQLDARDASSLRTSAAPLEIEASLCRIFPDGTWSKLEWLSYPMRAALRAMARQGLRDNPELALRLIRIGDVAIVGVPCELGPSVTAVVRQELQKDGIRVPIVASLCGGYAGYAHLRDEYDIIPASGYRALTYYENAMSVGGWDMGERIVATIKAAAHA